MHTALPDAQVMQVDSQATVMRAGDRRARRCRRGRYLDCEWLVKRSPGGSADAGFAHEARLHSAAVRQGDADWLNWTVFHGIPSIGGFVYDATTGFTMTLAFDAGAGLAEVFRAGLEAIPKGLMDAGRAMLDERMRSWSRKPMATRASRWSSITPRLAMPGRLARGCWF